MMNNINLLHNIKKYVKILKNYKGDFMQETILKLCKNFNLNGKLIKYNTFPSGHINTTYLVNLEINGENQEFVLQQINNTVFKKPDEVMLNISNVTNHIKNKLLSNNKSIERKVLDFLKTLDNKYYYKDEDGKFWRMYKFVNNSTTFDLTDNLKVITETGKAFGEFQCLLDDFPISNLNIIIPHFHNTVNRYKIFKSALKNDVKNRAKDVINEISEYLNLENLATKMYKMQKENKLHLRVTHNDTKCNNVLFDNQTFNHLCVIDLDTVMPGLIGFDFGDAIRFVANTSLEDETNLSKVKLDLVKFEAFTEGFLNEVKHCLTFNEKNTLSLGAITITIECGLRFLTDYLNGDVYFKTSYPEHNLDRARCQLTLAIDMINNYEKMQEIVNNCFKNKIFV
ncbi:MAG: mucin desulfatase [Clostridiales bacterium]|nr:mucin desulfatase [Clostridiales bacterium]